ncbi:hypothetical protein CEXT_304632 [Caerostris extrusa]|nr:hypothetical protein CEXT_304632 [Caerostris extrusa]
MTCSRRSTMEESVRWSELRRLRDVPRRKAVFRPMERSGGSPDTMRTVWSWNLHRLCCLSLENNACLSLVALKENSNTYI